MFRIQPYPVAVALSFVFLVLYLVCVGLHYVIPHSGWEMYRIWEMCLFGFTWLTPLSFLLGVLEVFLAGFFVAYTVIPLHNYFDTRESTQKGGAVMNALRFKPVAYALALFGSSTYILCVVSDLVFPQWAMHELWEILLPGFSWISWGSFFIGLVGVIVYSIYVAGIFVPIYNYFRASDLPELK